MFSRVSIRSCSIISKSINAQNKILHQTAIRCNTSIAKHLENWEKANKIYYGPERDTTNFPHKKQPLTSPPTRLGFIPDSFFQAFYEKTGVTGPYVLGVGFITYLLSSELWVIEHGFTEFISFWIAFYIMSRKLGPKIAAALDKSNDEYLTKNWEEPLKQIVVDAEQSIKDLDECIQQEQGQNYLFEAKQENVDLQLEAQYRQRMAEVHQSVKRRLDYQADTENAKRSFEQKHMVNWIVSSVLKNITPQQEKDSIKKCIQDLKVLSASS